MAGSAAFHQVVQETTALLAACLSDAEDSLHKPTTLAAVRPAAALPPQDGMTQGPLGGIVRRLDALVPDERPQLRLVGREELVEFWLSRCRRSSTCRWRHCNRSSYC